jgi:small-conductance mechanosensitive channel
MSPDIPDLGSLAQFIRWGGVLMSVPVIVVLVLSLRVINKAAEQLSARFAERRPTILLVQSIARFLIYAIASASTVSLCLRLDPTVLTVIGGALAFAVGFALRDTVSTLIAGLTIIFDRPFQVGDRVDYAGQYGDIIGIGLRSVRMNTLDHNIVTIPNNKILTDVTSSGNYGALEMQVAMDFYIGVDQNARLAIELIREACLTSPYVYLERPVPIAVRQMIVEDYVAVQLKARPYVFDCKYEEPFQSDVHLRVLEAWREHGILPPAVLHRARAEHSAEEAPPTHSERRELHPADAHPNRARGA